jgi:hypothetical protein
MHPLHTLEERLITLQLQKTIGLVVECFLCQGLQDAMVAVSEHAFLGIRVPTQRASSQCPGFGTLFALGKMTASDPFISDSVGYLDGVKQGSWV